MVAKSKPAGTPREGVNTRLTAELRAKLAAAAEAAGRSVGSEIEIRLLASFAAQTPSLTAQDVRQIVREEMGASELRSRMAAELHERMQSAGFGHTAVGGAHSHAITPASSDDCGTDCALLGGPCGRRACPWGYPFDRPQG